MDLSTLPIFLMLLCTAVLALGILAIARLLGGGRPGVVQQMPYESGMDPIHDTRRRFDVRFHLLAIAFLVFDVELLFLVPWAVAWGGGPQAVEARDQRSEVRVHAAHGDSTASAPQSPQLSLRTNSHLVFAGAMTFLVLLIVGYVYDWRRGVFQWR
ncbi:MAG: NADH-quinone oxidoreductase subunit A [Thermoguttaceae bacterium]